MFNDLNLKEDAEVTPREVLTLLFALALTNRNESISSQVLMEKSTAYADALLEQPK